MSLGDLLPGARTVIVNQSFAQVVFGGTRPAIGRRLRYAQPHSRTGRAWYQVVGVARDLGRSGRSRLEARLEEGPHLSPAGSRRKLSRPHGRPYTTGDPLLFASRLRSIARDVEPTLQISEIARFDQSRPQVPVR